MKKARLPSHRSMVNGFKKIHALLCMFSLTGTIIDTPDSVYGNVKSAYNDLLNVIVTSPTTASYFCFLKLVSNVIKENKSLVKRKKMFKIELYKP